MYINTYGHSSLLLSLLDPSELAHGWPIKPELLQVLYIHVLYRMYTEYIQVYLYLFIDECDSKRREKGFI